MSTYWGYRCETCHVDSDMYWNHGENILRKLAVIAPALHDLCELSGYVDVLIHSRSSEDPIEWLTKHKGHSIVLLNEYDTTEPIT